jgi:hypothetical protein
MPTKAHLNGARFGTPSSEMLETSAMGRGTTHEVNKGYISLSAFRVSEIYTMKACDKVKFRHNNKNCWRSGEQATGTCTT